MAEVAITPAQFGEMSEVVTHALKEITDNLKPSNRFEAMKAGLCIVHFFNSTNFLKVYNL